MERVVVCGANAYEGKYFLDPRFTKIPDDIKKELKIICVLFTEEVGGIITIGFDEEGELEIMTQSSSEDYMYDDIASGLLVSKIRATRQDLFEALNLFYRVVICGEQIDLEE